MATQSKALPVPAARVRSGDFREGLQSCAAIALVGGVALIDYAIGAELAFSIFYVAPVALAATVDRKRGVATAVFAAAAWWWVEVNTHPPFSHPYVPWWNTGVRLGIFVAFAFFVSELRQAKQQLQQEVLRRTSALQEEVAQRRALEREMAEMAAQEQARVARDLHDGVGQYLAGLSFRARVLLEDLRHDAPTHAPQAQKLVDLVDLANRETRRLDRMLQARAEGEDLVAALQRLVTQVQQLFDVSCAIDLPEAIPPLAPVQSDTLFRIAQEALNNAIKHGEANRLRLLLHHDAAGLQLIVSDQGRGLQAYSQGSGGAGLRIMHYRAELIGAKLDVRNAEGGGCVVLCQLPLDSEPATVSA